MKINKRKINNFYQQKYLEYRKNKTAGWELFVSLKSTCGDGGEVMPNFLLRPWGGCSQGKHVYQFFFFF